jgi:hypothetical protein
MLGLEGLGHGSALLCILGTRGTVGEMSIVDQGDLIISLYGPHLGSGVPDSVVPPPFPLLV